MHPETVNDVIAIEGYWWIPVSDSEVQKAFGRLTFQANGIRELFLYGAITSDHIPGSRQSVAWGECEGGKRITLFNLSLTSHKTQTSLTQTVISKWDFLQIWVGDVWFRSEADIKLLRYSYGINNLEIWHNLSCFKNEMVEKGKSHILSYQRPNILEIFENDTLRIFIEYVSWGPKMSVAQAEISLEHSPRVVVGSKDGRISFLASNDFPGMSAYAYKIYRLFALLIGQHVIDYDLAGVVDVDRFPIVVRFDYARVINSSQLKKSHIRNEILFPFAALGNDILRLLCENWVEAPAALHDAANSIIAFRNRGNSFEPITFPNLIFTFEGLHRAMYPALDDRASSHKEELLNQCPATVARKLRPITMGWASLPTRLVAAMKECCDIFPYIEKSQRQRLAEYIKDIRNNVAHSKGDFASDFYLIFNSARFVSLLMIALLMKRIGMPPSKIHECLSNTQEYSEVRTTLQEYLSECTKFPEKDNVR